MHTVCLWHTTTEPVLWQFDREPDLGEAIPVAGFGVFRVVSKHSPSDPRVDNYYIVEYVRDLTSTEELALSKGDTAFLLPPDGISV